MQDGKDRLGQEEEPAPIDGIQEAVDALVLFVGPNRRPFLRPREEPGFRGDGLTGRHGLRLQHGLGLIDVALAVIFRDGFEGAARRRDQGRHPVMIGEADPAISGDLRDLGARAFAIIEGEVRHVTVIGFGQRAVGHGDQAFVQNEEILQALRLSVAGKDPVWGHAGAVCAGILDALRDGEHEIRVDRDLAPEGEALAVFPHQGHRRFRAERIAALLLPHGVGAGNIFERDARAGCPAVKSVIGVRFADGRQHGHDIRIRLLADAVVLERQLIDAPAQQRDRPGHTWRLDHDPGCIFRRCDGSLGFGGQVAGGGLRRGRQGRRGHGGIVRVNGGLFRWGEQHEPNQNDGKAECCCQK